MVDTPECNRLAAVHDKRMVLNDFIEWLSERGIHLAEYPTICGNDHGGVRCACGHKTDWPKCGTGCADYEEDHRSQLESICKRPDQILMEYFEIDPNALERERCALLDACRRNSEAKEG